MNWQQQENTNYVLFHITIERGEVKYWSFHCFAVDILPSYTHTQWGSNSLYSCIQYTKQLETVAIFFSPVFYTAIGWDILDPPYFSLVPEVGVQVLIKSQVLNANFQKIVATQSFLTFPFNKSKVSKQLLKTFILQSGFLCPWLTQSS